MSYAGIILSAVFVNNLVLSRLLGVCPLLDGSRRTGTALGLGLALSLTLSLSALATWAVQHLALLPLGLGHLQTVTFIVVIAVLVRLLEAAVQRFAPTLAPTLGAWLPTLTANCAVLGLTLIAAHSGYGALETLVAGAAAGAGYLLALLVLSSLREKMEAEWVPRALRGAPITFITAGLMALAFLVFDQALLQNLLG